MADEERVAAHYGHDGLLDTIRSAVEKLGKSIETITVEDLGPVEEFHIGGRAATAELLDTLRIAEGDRVLDAGCGLGGSSRFAARRYGARVTGVDLTPGYVETGREMCRWVGLDARVDLRVGSVTDLPCDPDSFDKAFLIHVGMNVAEKDVMARELARVLKSDAMLGIYDVMLTSDGSVEFPVPWAAAASESVLDSPDAYVAALDAAGFTIESLRDRRAFALEFLAKLKSAMAKTDDPPRLGVHLLMGPLAPVKIENMFRAIDSGVVAPLEIVARRTG